MLNNYYIKNGFHKESRFVPNPYVSNLRKRCIFSNLCSDL